MGWKWLDDEPSGRAFDDLANTNLNPSEERFSTRRVVRSSCRTEEVEPGRFVRKCEKTEQLLMDCVGRPPQVVESNTEHTEVDVTEEMNKGLIPFDTPYPESFTFPRLQHDIEGIERTLFGDFRHFMEAAEEKTNELFQSMSDPFQCQRDSAVFGWPGPSDKPLKKNHLGQPSESSTSDYLGQMTDV